jgi:hypothetical protein
VLRREEKRREEKRREEKRREEKRREEKRREEKRIEEVHSCRGTVPGEFWEGDNTVNVSDKSLRHRSTQASTEAPDLGGDTGTSSDDNIEDETFPGQYELRRLGLMMMTPTRLRMRRMRKRMCMPWMRMMMTRVD